MVSDGSKAGSIMQQSSSGSYLDGIPGWQRLGRVDIHSRRPMEALPPLRETDAPPNLAPFIGLRSRFLGGTHA